jgi:hypothetical protein
MDVPGILRKLQKAPINAKVLVRDYNGQLAEACVIWYDPDTNEITIGTALDDDYTVDLKKL